MGGRCNMIREALRVARWPLALGAPAISLVFVATLRRDGWLSCGRCTIGVTQSQIELGWGSSSAHRSGRGWELRPQGAAVRIVMGPSCAWRPSWSGANVKVMASSSAVVPVSLTAVYVPLWLCTASLWMSAGIAWRFARPAAKRTGCPACGYDLRGLPAGRCPECGRVTTSMLRQVIAATGSVVIGIASRSRRQARAGPIGY